MLLIVFVLILTLKNFMEYYVTLQMEITFGPISQYKDMMIPGLQMESLQPLYSKTQEIDIASQIAKKEDRM